MLGGGPIDKYRHALADDKLLIIDDTIGQWTRHTHKVFSSCE